jgi:hypothetical protein
MATGRVTVAADRPCAPDMTSNSAIRALHWTLALAGLAIAFAGLAGV